MEDVIIEERNEPVVVNKPEPKVKIKKVVVKNKKKYGFFSYVANLINKTLVSGLFVAINFLLFCGAGNYDIFYGRDVVPEVEYVLYAIFVLAFATVFLLSFSRFLMNLFTAFVVGFFVLLMLGHFARFDTAAFLQPLAVSYGGAVEGGFFAKYSGIFAAGLTAFVAFTFFSFASRKKVFYLAFILAIVFVGIGANQFLTSDKKDDPAKIYGDKVVAAEKGKKFVYVALPNLASYAQLKDISEKHPAAQTALNAMTFLYNTYNFAVYPNAYVVSDDDALNIAQTLNLQVENDLLEPAVEIGKSWNFKDIAERKPQLKSAKLVDMFAKNKYAISVYESKDLDICYAGGKETADECYQKLNVPVLLDNGKFSVLQRTMVLVGEWLESSKLFGNYPGLYKFASTIIDVDEVPMLGMSYKNLSTMGALKVFDEVAKDVTETVGNKAYFVNLDVPSSLYIYDEFCQIKPLSDWVLEDSNAGKAANLLKKRDAYFEQSACVYGKLIDFVKKIKDSSEGENTVVVLQGTSGLDDFAGGEPEENFVNEKSITFALMDPKYKKLSIVENICSAPDILNQYLRKVKCQEFNGLEYNNDVKDKLANALSKYKPEDKMSAGNWDEFGIWYRNWLRANYPDMIIPIEMPMPELEVVEVEKAVLQEPAKVQDVKEETKPQEQSKSLKEVIKEEAAKEINYVTEIKVEDNTVLSPSEEAGSKVIIKIGAEDDVADDANDEAVVVEEQVVEVEENGMLSEPETEAAETSDAGQGAENKEEN